MTTNRYKTHNYKEGEVVLKKWFNSDILFKKFDAINDTEKRINLCNKIKVGPSRGCELTQPDCLITWHTADKYAIRVGYHPCMIWPDWFFEEPEEGSNPSVQKKKQPSMVSIHTFDTDMNRP